MRSFCHSVVFQVKFVFLLRYCGQIFCFSFYILYMPFGFEMVSLVSWSWKYCVYTTSGACENFFFVLFLLTFVLFFLTFFLLFLLICILFLLFRCFCDWFQCTELLVLKIFGGFIYDDIDQDLNGDFFIFLAHKIKFPIFIRLNIVDSWDCTIFFLFMNGVIDTDWLKLLGDNILGLLLKSDADAHISSDYLIFSLELFDAL